MKKVLIILGALLFSANSFAASIDVNQIHSAIQNSFNSHSSSHRSTSITYGGKDFSQPKVAIADEKLTSIPL